MSATVQLPCGHRLFSAQEYSNKTALSPSISTKVRLFTIGFV
jgi:hypothetical protein